MHAFALLLGLVLTRLTIWVLDRSRPQWPLWSKRAAALLLTLSVLGGLAWSYDALDSAILGMGAGLVVVLGIAALGRQAS